MEAETKVDQLTKKIQDSVDRSAELLLANKHYQFAQKIKSLAQRRAQTNKLSQAEMLLRLGIKKMFSHNVIEFNAVHDLIIALIELYETNKALWKKQTANSIYSLLTEKMNEKNAEYFTRILKNLSNINEAPEMADFIVDYFQKKDLFYRAESLVAHMNLSRVLVFLESWHDKIDQDQYAIVVCRMALLRGLHYDFDEPMVLLSDLDAGNPFAKFTKFLILSVQMKSRESYEKIGLSYRKFLDSDSFFDWVYQTYGAKYFSKEKNEAGLLNLLQK